MPDDCVEMWGYHDRLEADSNSFVNIFIRFRRHYFDEVKECVVENIIEQYQERIEHEFNALCKIIIRHASAEAKSKVSKRWKREISSLKIACGTFCQYCGGIKITIKSHSRFTIYEFRDRLR